MFFCCVELPRLGLCQGVTARTASDGERALGITFPEGFILTGAAAGSTSSAAQSWRVTGRYFQIEGIEL